ncbi:hypothetical protein Ddye_011415 [Dipteronia dyeriana]|uniref:Small ribosomal subunit protein uS14m n=1 Tax=Dipteronia dyeriana TaxID=168575 RepID=A0AAD9X2G1_9ROSI|nr:hypothetical protein Ddye_011415 [Dipteronia dyeriana]
MAFCRQNLSSIASQCVNFCRRQMSTVSEKRNIEDHKRRLLAAKYEVKRKLYKALHRDVDLPNELREKFLCKLAQLPRNSSFTRVRNRCIFTGRPRAVYEKFRMSRIVFRSLASQADLLWLYASSCEIVSSDCLNGMMLYMSPLSWITIGLSDFIKIDNLYAVMEQHPPYLLLVLEIPLQLLTTT